MNNLQRVYRIWNDLESSFRLSKYSDRSEYLKTLVGYKDGTTDIDYIISRIQENINNFSQKEEEMYSKILVKLQSAQKIFNNYDFDNIADLNTLIDSYTTMGNITSDILYNICLHDTEPPKPPITKGTLGELYDVSGFIGSSIKFVNGAIQVTILEDNHAVLLLPNLISRARFQEYCKKVPFGKYCLQSLPKIGTLDEPILFIDNTYFKDTPSRITLNIGSLRKYKNKNTVTLENIGDIPTYIFKRDLFGVEYNIVCVGVNLN